MRFLENFFGLIGVFGAFFVGLPMFALWFFGWLFILIGASKDKNNVQLIGGWLVFLGALGIYLVNLFG